MEEVITLDYGSGGRKTSQLIEEMLLPKFNNETLSNLGDGAILKGSEKLVFSTDSFVVSPLFFPGGDIGKLSVCGTVNDLSVCGATPKYLSLSFIIEEGLNLSDFTKIVDSIAKTASECNVSIVTGDTKVVERGKGDGIFINTTGIGFLENANLSPKNIKKGDSVIVSGNIGDHGVAVMLARSGLLENSAIVSDCAALNELTQSLLKFGDKIRVMRDPTRGGVATTLCEFVEGTTLSVELKEEILPITSSVMSACDLLGLDPLYSANEGKILVICDSEVADEVISEMKKIEVGKNSAIIGEVTDNYAGRVALKTKFGGIHALTKLQGAQLPRIC